MLKISTLDICLKITNLKLQPHLPGTNELIISEVLWLSPERNFMASAQASILYNEFENDIF